MNRSSEPSVGTGSDPTPYQAALTPTASALTPEGQRRADLAMAAARGATDVDLVLSSDGEGLALLGIDGESPLLADVLRWQGTVLRDRAQTGEAEALYRRSLHVAQKFDYLAGQAHAVNCLGGLAQRRGELKRANQLFQTAQRMAEGCGDHQLAGMVQQNRGVIADIAGNTDAALSHYSASLRSFEATNDTRSMTLVHNNLGLLHVKMGRYDDARESYDCALSLARTRGDLLCEGVIEENLAELEMMRGDLSSASESIARALEIAILRQDPGRRAAGLKLLGESLRLAGRAREAIGPLNCALKLSEDCEDALLSGEIMYEYGLALAATGDVKSAAESWAAALGVFEQIGATTWTGRVQDCLSARVPQNPATKGD